MCMYQGEHGEALGWGQVQETMVVQGNILAKRPALPLAQPLSSADLEPLVSLRSVLEA